jgi:hypothetical protein
MDEEDMLKLLGGDVVLANWEMLLPIPRLLLPLPPPPPKLLIPVPKFILSKSSSS